MSSPAVLNVKECAPGALGQTKAPSGSPAGRASGILFSSGCTPSTLLLVLPFFLKLQDKELHPLLWFLGTPPGEGL